MQQHTFEKHSSKEEQLHDNYPPRVGKWAEHVNMAVYWQDLSVETPVTVTWPEYWQLDRSQDMCPVRVYPNKHDRDT